MDLVGKRAVCRLCAGSPNAGYMQQVSVKFVHRLGASISSICMQGVSMQMCTRNYCDGSPARLVLSARAMETGSR